MVEVITTRGGQSLRVKRLATVTPPGSAWTPTGQLVATIGEVRAILGDAFQTLGEVRERRFDGGRRACEADIARQRLCGGSALA